MKGIEETFVELVVSVIGWLINMAILGGAFGVGFVTANWWGSFDPTISGFLSAAAVVWLYEHRIAHARWEKLSERLDRLWAKANGLG